MSRMTLLGAGASAEAGIPTAVGMTERMLELLPHGPESKALRLVIGGLQFQRGVRGEDPFAGLNIEEVFAAVDMLARRHELEIAPFVGQWAAALDELEVFRRDSDRWSSEFYRLRRAMEKWTDNLTNPGMRTSAQQEYLQAFENLFEQVTERAQGSAFRRTRDKMTTNLVDMVWLDPEGADVDYLIPLVQPGRNGTGTIATLNYDNTIEIAAARAGTPLSTGITEWSQTGLFEPPDDGIELLKLHGSIDWTLARYRRSDDSPLPHDVVKQIDAEKMTRPKHWPGVLFGGGNKLTAHGPFLELLRTFRQRLADHDELVVIGYSFGDDHVNDAIFRWMNGNPLSRIVIIDAPGVEPTNNEFHRHFGEALGERCEVLGVGAGVGIAGLP